MYIVMLRNVPTKVSTFYAKSNTIWIQVLLKIWNIYYLRSQSRQSAISFIQPPTLFTIK